jgi:phosphoglycolate phosphatase
MSVRPERCLYIGDTRVDMLTGRAAGMHTVGVAWGFRSVEELREHGADAIVQTPSELLDLFGA